MDCSCRPSADKIDAGTAWQKAERLGMSRREFVRLWALGGAAAVFGGRFLRPATAHAQQARASQMFFKKEEPLLKVFDTELGTRWDQQTTWITPVEHFYVRNRYASPAVDPKTWRLKVSGDAVGRPFELTYDELLKMRSRQAIRYMECFGNGRTLNWEQLGHDVRGGNWGFSDVSQGEWTYVPMAEILDRAQVKGNAVQLLFWSGVDGPDTGRPMPIKEITDRPEIIGLAYGLNGMPLHGDHGGPVRALVPGWGGAASLKWLTEIRISSHKFWTRMHTKEEALIGPDYPAEQSGPNDEFLAVTARDIRGITGTWLNVKSHLTVPLVMRKSDPPGRYPLQKGEVPTMPAGRRIMRGYAYAPSGIQRVDYSTDEGKSWQTATLLPPADLEYAWVRFEFPWEARPGAHVLMTRATDRRGNTQPPTVPFNQLGILCNAIPRFEVRVA
jgi:DMSO/TMAO reductase YedYZ molybdopterin-dependent catalytic subunit